jgi:hypothetical protein
MKSEQSPKRVEDVDIAREAAELEKPLRDQTRGGEEIVNLKASRRDEYNIREEGPWTPRMELDKRAAELSAEYIAAAEKVPKSEAQKEKLIKESIDKVAELASAILKKIETDYPRMTVKEDPSTNLDHLRYQGERDISKWVYGKATETYRHDFDALTVLFNYANKLDMYRSYLLELDNNSLVSQHGGFKFIPDALGGK